jgi:hypothetical protein
LLLYRSSLIWCSNLYHFLQQGALDVENSKTSLVFVINRIQIGPGQTFPIFFIHFSWILLSLSSLSISFCNPQLPPFK